MIKYTRLNSNKILLELTTNKLKRKNVLRTKKKLSLRKNDKTLMASIIQKIKFLKSRLNFFDLIVFLAILIVLVFFIYNRLQRKSTWVNIRISVANVDWWYKGSSPAYWYAHDLKVGDIVKNSFGEVVAEVINVDNYALGGPYRAIYVDLKIKVDFDQKKNQYLYEFKPITVGSSLLLNFSNQQLRGLIVAMGDKAIEYSYKTIKVTKTGVLPFFAEQVTVGSQIHNTQGDLVAEILDVKIKPNKWYQFSDIRGKTIEVNNPDFRNLEIILKIKTFKDLGIDFYVDESVIKLGARVWLQFPNFALDDAEIIEVIE